MKLPDIKNHNNDPIYIRELLDKANLSQRHFSRLIGVNDRTVRNWVAVPSIPYSAQYCLEVLAANKK
jgi:DNA-binding transcriptional regulator YiaG